MLKRCLVGFSVGTGNKSKAATLSDTRRWSSSSCSQVHGMSIYEMVDVDFFLNLHLKLGLTDLKREIVLEIISSIFNCAR